MIASETGQILYDYGSDLTVFYHLLHFLKSRSVEGRTRYTVVHEETVVYDPVLLTVFLQDLLLVRDTVRLQFLFTFFLADFLNVVNLETAVKRRY
jgi:hypothetical protein